ncbi:MAG: hypothetical protein HYZ36_02385 [Pedosphaera parvula]|nr:hypothetical protein [Pedosphaera parvula]
MNERPFAFSLALSLLIHVTVFLLLLGWHRSTFRNTPMTTHIKQALVQQSAARAIQKHKTEPKSKPAVEREAPLLFVEVDPQTVTPEAPIKPKYYSSVSSRAANPDPTIQSTVPKIDGKQERIARTFDSPRPQAKPLQPTPMPLTKAEPLKAQPAAPPKRAVERPAEKPAEPAPKAQPQPGNTMLAKAEPTPTPQITVGSGGQGSAKAQTEAPAMSHERPRTLVAAKQQQGMMAGERMKQDGGVSQRGRVSLDVKGTAFGAYDAYIIAAIQQRWYALLDERDFARDRTGKVVLEFRLYHDGRVTDMATTDTSVGDLLAYICQKAVLDPAPYEKWPSDMRKMIGQDYRDVRFTFYYN